MHTQITEESKIKLYPEIMDKGSKGTLWVLIKDLDKDNCGYVYVSVNRLCEMMNFKRASISNLLSSDLFYDKKQVEAMYNVTYPGWSQDKHIYHKNNLGECVYKIYYKPISEVVKVLGIDKSKLVFAIASTTYFTNTQKKVVISETLLMCGQKYAQYAAKCDPTTKRNQRLFNPPHIFDKSQENNMAHGFGIIPNGNNAILINENDYKIGVVSQKYVAKMLGRSVSTINRRMAKSTLNKKQLYVTSSVLQKEHKSYFEQNPDAIYRRTATQLIMNIEGRMYKKHCCVYDDSNFEIGIEDITISPALAAA